MGWWIKLCPPTQLADPLRVGNQAGFLGLGIGRFLFSLTSIEVQPRGCTEALFDYTEKEQ